MSIHRGPMGSATKLDGEILKPVRPDQEATLAAWFLRAPLAHPLWDAYLVFVIHLRDIAGVRAAVKRTPSMTHELMVVALNPELQPQPNDRDSWQHLTPINIAVQFELDDDEKAARLAELTARACVDGLLTPEPTGILGARSLWERMVTRTVEHMQLGGHPQTEQSEVSH